MLPTNEQLYAALPSWLQSVAISLYGIRWRNERLGGRFDEYVREFRERDRWPADTFSQWLDERLREKLVLAWDSVPYYRRVWNQAGIVREDLQKFTRTDLCRLPSTPKDDFRSDQSSFLREGVSGQQVRKYHSSGSTGTPITAACTPDDHRRFIAAREARSFGWAGVSVQSPRSMIGGRMVVTNPDAPPPYHRYNLAEQQVYFSAFHIAPENAIYYVDALNRYRPDVLTGYAQSHFLLGRMMLAQGLALKYRPKALILSSEQLTPSMRTVIQQAFGARAWEEYGAVENVVLATECEYGRLHAHQDFGIVEIVDEGGQPVPPGVEGRILCTGLQNETQLLVRYEIGDLGVWDGTDCPCGRNHLPVLSAVTGRIEDVVIGPDGRELVRFHGIFIDAPHVLAGQIVQESHTRIVIRVIATAGFGDADRRLLAERVRARLGSVDVHVQTVSALERTARGKVRAVISHVRQDATGAARANG